MTQVWLGIDLAWGTRAPTGVAAVGGDGGLIDSATLLTDAEIDAWVARPDWSPACVAIDAPLVVTNEAGQRPCESQMTSAYGRYAAGCHSSNRGISWFNPPRGGELARRHGWQLDVRVPPTTQDPLALEAHPHAAMVGWWSLPRTLAYKARAGRGFGVRKVAFDELVARLEATAELQLVGHPRWQHLRGAVDSATRHVDLERVEDEIDGIVCALIAWRWQHQAGALAVYGEAATGWIVAPPAPQHPSYRALPHHDPTRRAL